MAFIANGALCRPLPFGRHFLYLNEREGWRIIRPNEAGKQQKAGKDRAALGASDAFLPVDSPWCEGVGLSCAFPTHSPFVHQLLFKLPLPQNHPSPFCMGW